MVGSSLRNTMARRNHKERAQPLNRKRLGLLEKHKDYVQRARDYKSKQDRIRKLREKAAFRNKDEFYYGMVKKKTLNGVEIGGRGNEALPVDVVKILKTQDAGWVKVQIARDEKRIRAELEISAPAASRSDEWDAAAELAEVEKMAEMGIVLSPASGSGSSRRKGKARETPGGHVIFLEDRGEFDSYDDAPSTTVENVKQDEVVDLGWEEPAVKGKSGKNQASSTDQSESKRSDNAAETEEEARQTRLDLLTALSAHLARIRLLRQTEAKLEQTKGLMGKGAARKTREEGFIDDPTAEEDRNGERKKWLGKAFKWKLERRK